MRTSNIEHRTSNIELTTARFSRGQKRGRAAVLGAAVAAVLAGMSARGADWDPVPGVAGAGNGLVDGGGGMWDTSAGNWTIDGGVNNATWVNGDSAVFGGSTGGLVTLVSGGVLASGLVFNATSDLTLYTLQSQTSSDVLLLSGGSITMNQSARIDAVLGGVSGFSKLGAATLTLGGDSTISGNLTLVQGTLDLASANGAGTSTIIVNTGTTLRANAVTAGNAINLAGGTLGFVSNDAGFGGPISVSAGSIIALGEAGKTLTLSGVISGTNGLTIDGTGGGSLLVNNAANHNGSVNTFTGNVSLSNGASVTLAYRIAAPAGQAFSASSGSLTLGNSIAGATVSLASGASATASSGGVINLFGRAAAPGLGVSIGGTLIANSLGRINIGDGLDDASQVQLLSTAQLTADGGTIALRPRGAALTLNGTTGAIAIANGGVLALGAGGADLLLNHNVTESGSWVLANESASTFTIAGGVQDSTAGLTLRAHSGIIRYDVVSSGVDSAAVNGSVNLEPRGGTIDLSNAGSGRTLNYASGYTLSGWGQIGSSASNLTHIMPAGGATFYAGGSSSVTLTMVGGYDQALGPAKFRIGDNNTLEMNVPNATPAAALAMSSITIDPQSGDNIARLVVAGGNVQANTAAFVTPANRVKLEVAGGTLISDVSGTNGVLVNGAGAMPINVTGGGTFISTAPTFTLGAGLSLGSSGTLFGFNGTSATNLVLHGTVDLNGTLGGAIAAASTGTLRLDSQETLTLGAAGDLSGMSLAYAGTSGAALLEVNSGTGVVRIGSATALTSPYGDFLGTREFKLTGGTLQVDSSNAAAVTITGVNQVSVPRSGGTLTGTLTLNGGTFHIGSVNVAATTTVDAAGTLIGRGVYGHNSGIDNFINNGTVTASGGNLTIYGGTIRATGTFNPGGQTLTLIGNLRDVGGVTTLRVSGSNGGTVLLGGTTSNYTGGTFVENSGGTGPILRVTANNLLGSGTVTLSGATLAMLTDNGLSYTNSVSVQGALSSTVNFDRIGTSAASKNVFLGPLSLGGQTLNLVGANSYRLTFAGTTIRAGAAGNIVTSGGGGVTMTLGALDLQSNLNLSISSSIFNIGSLSGAGTINRTGNSGTLIFTAPAGAFSGQLLTAGGTTAINGSNALAGGTWSIGTIGSSNGTFNVTNSLGLNLSSGTMSGGSFNLGSGANLGSLNGAQMNLAGGTVFANVAGALGSGTVTITGGRLHMKGETGTSFGGTVIIRGGNSVLVDRFSTGIGQVHTIGALGVISSTMNLTGPNGYGLGVTGDTTISGTSGSTINNSAANLSLNRLVLNAPLILAGTGAVSIAQLSGTASLAVGVDAAASVAVTSTPVAGYAGSVDAANGTLNLNSIAGSLAGGSLSVTGGAVHLGVSGALQQTSVTMSSGFIYANASDALAGQPITITNGSLVAGVNNALGASVITMTGGNITAMGAGSLGTAAISMNRGVLALRSNGPAAFGGSVTITGTNFATISVASIDPLLAGPNQLSIPSLSLGGQTLNITGDGQDVLVVSSAVALSGTNPTTFNNTAADGLIQGAVTGSGGVIKSGAYTMTFDGGGNFGTARVDAGTLVINNTWTSSGVTVGGSNGAATLQLGGSGVNTPGTITVNAGTLRLAKATVANAVPTATALGVGRNGDVKIEYAGLGIGTLVNTINVDASLGNRVLTLWSGSGSLASQTSTLLFTGTINRTGTNALNVTVGADTTLDDGIGNLVRPPSRIVMASNQTFTTPMVHGGGIVIARGNLPAIASPTPTVFGQNTNALSLSLNDSTIGAMPADGQSGATFGRTVTTSGQWTRLGGFYNPSGAAGVQTVQFSGSFAWNGTSGLAVVIPAGSATSGASMSRWNGLMADPQTVLQINSGSILDNVITASGTAVTSAAPVYIGGGGTVRLNTSFDAAPNIALARGLSGMVGVLDSTTLQSLTGGKHFEGVQLLTGTFQVSGTNQTVSGGLQARVSPFDGSRVTSNLIADSNLTVTGTGAPKAFKIGGGAILLRSGAGTVNFNGDHAHEPGGTFQANQSTTNFNTDAGGSTSPGNTLSLAVSNGASVNLTVTQHLANVVVHSGVAQLTSSVTGAGAKLIEATGVSVTGGKLDLTNNRLIVDYSPGNSPLASIAAQIAGGYNAAGTKWAGNGIISSTAASNATTYGIGFGEASDLLGAGGGAFGSETVDGTSVLARYTRLGDADLNGAVDFFDLTRLAANYGNAGIWSAGDFNYDGQINFFDLTALAANYGGAIAGEPVPGASAAFSEDMALAFASVPEPGTLAVLAIAGAALMLRRRRRPSRLLRAGDADQFDIEHQR